MPEALDDKVFFPRIISFIDKYTRDEGYPPTFREIGDAVGVGSTSTIHHMINRLVQNGRVTMVGGKSRTLRLVQHGEDTGRMSGGAGTGGNVLDFL